MAVTKQKTNKSKQHPLYRKVTHTHYTGVQKLIDKNTRRGLQKVIVPLSEFFYKSKMGHPVINDEYIQLKVNTLATPIVGGGVALVFVFLGTYDLLKDGVFEPAGIYIYIVAWLLFLLFIAYYFTMPKKEIILDRLNGTITFPGWMWNKNITMPFNNIKFTHTTGGSNMVGAYQLVILRPDKAGSILHFPFPGIDCYQDLAYLTWYMDKNRPLPPKKEFASYRQKDFERRKTAKFK